jgi:hypothetical protein
VQKRLNFLWLLIALASLITLIYVSNDLLSEYGHSLVKKKNCFVFAGTLIVLVGVIGRTEQFYCLKGWQQVDYIRSASQVLLTHVVQSNL